MGKKSKKKNDNGMKFLCLVIVIMAFGLAFGLLIKKQFDNSYLNDVSANKLNVIPEVGKTIVAKDNNAIYPKYYVVNISGDAYSIYVYNYYDTISQYELEFNRLINSIVDYNSKNKMIRYIHSRGYGTYYEILSNLPILVECDNLKIY